MYHYKQTKIRNNLYQHYRVPRVRYLLFDLNLWCKTTRIRRRHLIFIDFISNTHNIQQTQCLQWWWKNTLKWENTQKRKNIHFQRKLTTITYFSFLIYLYKYLLFRINSNTMCVCVRSFCMFYSMLKMTLGLCCFYLGFWFFFICSVVFHSRGDFFVLGRIRWNMKLLLAGNTIKIFEYKFLKVHITKACLISGFE